MTHRFPIKEIARQAALSTATIDRVINNRANVSPQTIMRVNAAIAELTMQEAQLAARGRRLFFDFIIDAPSRFSREVKTAAESVLPLMQPAVCRPRFLLQDMMGEDAMIAALQRLLKRGSHGVCLKARDTPKIRKAVDALVAAKIPVVTLVTDIAESHRLAYVGLDNAGAGRTAAYLVANSVGDGVGTVLATRSHERFLGEEEREIAFLKALAERCPQLHVIKRQGGNGLDLAFSRTVSAAISDSTNLRAVYSMGGGNQSILQALENKGQTPTIFIAHDLDQDNRTLIMERKVDYILHHDLQLDLKNVFSAFLAYHKLLAAPPQSLMSTVQILTPENIPRPLG